MSNHILIPGKCTNWQHSLSRFSQVFLNFFTSVDQREHASIKLQHSSFWLLIELDCVTDSQYMYTHWTYSTVPFKGHWIWSMNIMIISPTTTNFVKNSPNCLSKLSGVLDCIILMITHCHSQPVLTFDWTSLWIYSYCNIWICPR